MILLLWYLKLNCFCSFSGSIEDTKNTFRNLLTFKVPRCLSLVFVFLIAVLIYSLLFFRATIASWCHSSTFSCSQLFGDHLAAVRWNSRWPARSARSAASRRPPKPPKRPHCHLTRFLSWLCVRCAQQPRKFVWRLRIDADIKKNLHTNKTLFWTNI